MSYIFPRRVLRAQDVLDPIELTLDISPAAERLSGRLNAHNFNQNIAATVPLAPEVFYKPHYVSVTADPKFGGPAIGSPYQLPIFPGTAGADPNAYRVTNTFEWQTIDDQSGTPLSVAVSTGVSVLWVNAFVQYLWAGFNGGTSVFGSPWGHDYAGPSARPCNIQFAIRVDGSVIEDTITGVDQIDFRSSMALKARLQRSSGSFLPGPQDVRGNIACSLGPPAMPVRLTLCLPVQAGDHTVEVVARRVPDVRDVDIDLSYTSGDFVAVFNRQLLVVDLKSFPTDSVGGAEVSAPAWDEEELITTTEIYTDRMQRIITRSNTIQEGNLGRGALMHYHLPSALLGAYTTEVHYPSGEIFNNVMPGQNSDTVTLTHYAGLPPSGWALVTDFGAAPGGPLYLSAIPTLTAKKLLVFANVQVRNIQGGAVVDRNDFRAADIGIFGLFRIMWQSTTEAPTTWHSGTLPGATPSAVSDGMINNFVWWPSDPTTDPVDPQKRQPIPAYGLEQVEVPLMMLLDLSTVSPAIPAVNLGVFCGTSGGFSGTDAQFEIRFGSIIALALRA